MTRKPLSGRAITGAPNLQLFQFGALWLEVPKKRESPGRDTHFAHLGPVPAAEPGSGARQR